MEEILASIRRIIADDETKPIAEIAAEAQAAAAAQLDAGRRVSSEKIEAAGGAKPDPFRDGLRAVAHDAGPNETLAPSPGDAAVALRVDDDVLELTDDMALSDPVSKGFRRVEPVNDIEFADSRPAVSHHRDRNARSASADAAPAPEGMSRATVSAVESAFNTLAATVLSNNARTLEDLVKEMLRPMLKNWLDDNLPSLVERLVRAEIERVSRGR